MAAKAPAFSFLLFSLLTYTAFAQTAAAPASPAPLNFTGILDKNNQYKYFLKLLTETQVGNQIQNQLNGTTEGLTVFAPTDNAFNSLKPGTINGLDMEQKVRLILYHVISKYYALDDLEFVSNPVRTEATGPNGELLGLNFTGQNNQVNVSADGVVTRISNALYQNKPLAVFQVDKVFLPAAFSETKPDAPSSGFAPAPTPNASTVDAPSPGDDSGSSTSGRSMGSGLVFGLTLACIGALS